MGTKITHLCAGYFVVCCYLSVVLEPAPFLLSDIDRLAMDSLTVGWFSVEWAGQGTEAAVLLLVPCFASQRLRLTLVQAADKAGLQVVSVFFTKEFALRMCLCCIMHTTLLKFFTSVNPFNPHTTLQGNYYYFLILRRGTGPQKGQVTYLAFIEL